MRQKKNTILVIDHEAQTKKILDIILPAPAYKVEECKTGQQAAHMCISLKPDMILLDLELPDMSGHDVIAQIREWSHVPLMIVTSRSDDADMIKALNLGADDYVLKPFNADVLAARINAGLRKGAVNETGQPQLTNGPLRMDLVRHQVFIGENLIPLTPKEYNLLRYLMIHSGKMLTQKQILTEVWGPAHGADAQYLRVFIGQIRSKLRQGDASTVVITTEPGVGYRMEAEQDLKTKNIRSG